MKYALSAIAAIFAMTLVCHAQESVAEPGQKVRERTAADVELLYPQRGVGGSERITFETTTPVSKEFEIEVEGCEKLKGHVTFPAGMDRDKEHPLMLAFDGSGDDTGEMMSETAKISDGRDPVIVCAITYCELIDEGEYYRIERLVEEDELRKAAKWLIGKVKEDYSVDDARIFLFGGNGGHGESADIAEWWWKDDADGFPFRAVLLDGLVTLRDVSSMPPVPHVIVVSKDHIEMNEKFGMKRKPSNVANELMARGIPALYHEYDESGFSSRGDRAWLCFRDAINVLGGPGAREYPVELATVPLTDDDKLSFTESEDRYVKEVVTLLNEERWKDAVDRANEVLDNRKVKGRDKRELKSFMKDFEKWAKDEMERLNDWMTLAINNDEWPNPVRKERLAALNEVFKEESWCERGGFTETLETLKTFGPVQRDNENKIKLMEAYKLELAGKREEAKKAYIELDKKKDQDAGQSVWPRAAEYRLSWWQD